MAAADVEKGPGVRHQQEQFEVGDFVRPKFVICEIQFGFLPSILLDDAGEMVEELDVIVNVV